MLVGAVLVQGVAAADLKIEAYAGSNGAISPSGIIFVSEGDDQLFIFTPNVGYLVSDIIVDGSSVGAVLDYRFVNVVSNHTIRAAFVRSAYTIDASAGQGGSISPSGSITVNAGKSKIFTITPGHDYHIADVIIDGSSVGSVSSYPFTNVQSNHVIQASFFPNPGSIYVTSVPPKAVIYLDDNSVGTTPKLVKDVTPGVHSVRLTMTRYEEWSTQVVVSPGSTEIISPTLIPLTIPTTEPTTVPTTVPTTNPTTVPTTVPTTNPTTVPTTVPTTDPTTVPTTVPTTNPTTVPTTVPTTDPTTVPTTIPTTIPTTVPTTIPTTKPTTIPTTATITANPTTVPTKVTVSPTTTVLPVTPGKTQVLTTLPVTGQPTLVGTANPFNSSQMPQSSIAGSGIINFSGNNTTSSNQSGPESLAIPLFILMLTALPTGLLLAGDLSSSIGKRTLNSKKYRVILSGGYAVTAGLLLYGNVWIAGRLPEIQETESVIPGYFLLIVSSYFVCSGIALSVGAFLSRPLDRTCRIHLIPGVIVALLTPVILVALGSGYIPASFLTIAALVSSGLALWQIRLSTGTTLVDKGKSPTNPDVATQFTGGRTITSMEVRQDLFPSELRDRYHEMTFLGMGGMSRVFSAKRNTDGRMVAVKIPISFDTTTGKCFMKEILAWEGLRHDNIVEITEANILPVPYVEMEYIKLTLEDIQKPLPARKAAEIVCGIAEGLAYAHERAIIHRDIKPQNILLTPDGVPKITDWGMSRAVGTSMLPTVTGFSLSYAAPEQVSPGKFGETDQRTDIYQLGVVFYELVTGQSLFSGDDLVEVSTSIISAPPAPPSTINKDACGLDAIILKCLAKKPVERYDSVRSLLDDLHAYLRQESPPTNPLTESEAT